MLKINWSNPARVARTTHSEAAVRAQPLHPRGRRHIVVSATASAPPDSSSSNVNLGELATTVPKAPRPSSPFLELGVDPLIAASLPALDVRRPSPIQSAALPAILSGCNCAVQSYTGSGKTLSYLLPALTLALRRAAAQSADPSTPRRGGLPDMPIQLLVVAPSQELAMQIMRVAKSLLPPGVGGVQQVIGGANPKRQVEALGEVPGPLVVVGTPGRLSEMIRTGALKLHMCPIMVLDEADQLLAPAFAEDIHHISDHCGKRLGPKPGSVTPPPEEQPDSPSPSTHPSTDPLLRPLRRQTVLVSATLSPALMARAVRWCPDPRFVSAGGMPGVVPEEEQAGQDDNSIEGANGESPVWGWGARGWDGPASPLAPKTAGAAGGVGGSFLVPTLPPGLTHYFLVAPPRHRVDVLRRAVHALGIQRALVFMNWQQRVQDTQYKLQARGMKVAALHGELPRLVRSNLLNDFRRGRLRALVVSDVAARGLDVPSCDAVFQLELPSSPAHYAHRAGRTGRLAAALAAAEAAEAEGVEETGEEGETGEEDGEGVAASGRPVGTVVTIVAPSERFVVDKLAKQLGVPLMEAHVSHGQFHMGPPPAGYSFERDDESDRDTTATAEGAPSTSGKAKGTAAAAGKGTGTAVAAADEGASRPGKQRKWLASTSDADTQPSTSGRTVVDPAAAAKAEAAAARAAARAAAEAARFEILVDEDDDIILDDEEVGPRDTEDYDILDEDLQAFKRLRPAQIRALAEAGGGAAGIELKAKKKKRVTLEGLVSSRLSEGAAGGGDGDEKAQGEAAQGSGAELYPRKEKKARGEKSARARRRAGKREEDEEGRDEALQREGAEGARPRGKTREEVFGDLRRELEELRQEKEASRALLRGRGAARQEW